MEPELNNTEISFANFVRARGIKRCPHILKTQVGSSRDRIVQDQSQEHKRHRNRSGPIWLREPVWRFYIRFDAVQGASEDIMEETQNSIQTLDSRTFFAFVRANFLWHCYPVLVAKTIFIRHNNDFVLLDE